MQAKTKTIKECEDDGDKAFKAGKERYTHPYKFVAKAYTTKEHNELVKAFHRGYDKAKALA